MSNLFPLFPAWPHLHPAYQKEQEDQDSHMICSNRRGKESWICLHYSRHPKHGCLALSLLFSHSIVRPSCVSSKALFMLVKMFLIRTFHQHSIWCKDKKSPTWIELVCPAQPTDWDLFGGHVNTFSFSSSHSWTINFCSAAGHMKEATATRGVLRIQQC